LLSAYEGDVGGDVLLEVAELVAEARGEEVVFDADADLCASDEDQDCRNEEWRGRDEEAGAEQEAEHRCVDGMTEVTVGAGADEFVIGAKGGLESQVSSEGAGAGPGQEDGEREEEDGEGNLPGCGSSGPEMALP